jgi:hypothetical protein
MPTRSGQFRILYLHQKNLVAGDQNVVVCRWAAALKSGGNARHGLFGLHRGNAHHRPKHAAKHLPPAGPQEARAEVCAAGANGTSMR